MKNFAQAATARVSASDLRFTIEADTEKREAGGGIYAALIDKLFQHHSVVAVVSAIAGQSVTPICREIASELSARDRRVVVVSIHALLSSNLTVPLARSSFIPAGIRNVWMWPALDASLTVEESGTGSDENWLDSLRGKFNSIVLDCPSPDAAPASAAIAALADAAVLAVEAGRTDRQQVHLSQRMLELCAVKMAGCILVVPR